MCRRAIAGCRGLPGDDPRWPRQNKGSACYLTTIHLIRHGDNDLVGHTIAGRTPGVHLNETGRRQACHLAEYLAQAPITQIFSSPLERARETAEPLATKLSLEIQISSALNELDFGDWTGKTIVGLEGLEAWKQWNTFRSAGRIPNGESMLEVQARVVGEIERLRRRHPDQVLACFGHGDPTRAALAYYLGMPLDMLLRLEISFASVSTFTMDDRHVRFTAINFCP